MTELYTKAIVKLPRKNRHSSMVDDSDYLVASKPPSPVNQDISETKKYYEDFLVGDKLYLNDLPLNVTEAEVMDLVKSFEPIHVQLNRINDGLMGYVQFRDRKMADRAFTSFSGGIHIIPNTLLQFKMNPPGDYSDPEPQSGLLHIKNLPSQTTNNSLYDLFRPFGPMNLCKIILEPGTTVHKGTALIQYFFAESAENAETEMNNKTVQDNVITVMPYVPSKSKINQVEPENRMMRSMSNSLIPTSVSPPPPSPAPKQSQYHQHQHQQPPLPPSYPSQQQQHPIAKSENQVDYTNLYIKNLDLGVKSADLFSHFRRFGRIISARVMKNPQTRQSKGFGFVSFSKADEAIMAKEEMNGVLIMSKPVIIAFHEPKKSRDMIPTTNTNTTTNAAVPTFVTSLSSPMPQNNNNNRYHQRPPPLPQQQHGPISPPIIQPTHMIHHISSSPSVSLPSFDPHTSSALNTSITSSSFEPHISNGYYHLNNKHHHDFDSRYTNSISNHSAIQQHQQQDYLPFNTNNNNHHNHNHHNNNNISSSYPMDRHSYSHHSHTYENGGGGGGGIVNSGPRSYSQLHIPKDYSLKRQLSHPGQQQQQHHQPGIGPSLSTLASRSFIHSSSTTSAQFQNNQYHHINNHQQPIHSLSTTHIMNNNKKRPTLRRRGSVESSVSALTTETSSFARRQTVTKAVLALDDGNEKNINDIVDMLLTLKRRDLATCLFNQVFLREKIKQAKDALETFQDGGGGDESNAPIHVNTTTTTIPEEEEQQQQQVEMPFDSMNNSNGLKDKDLNEQIDCFLDSLKGLPLHEQKQLLGDRLFPLVKSTGVKHAPRITIRLLDSVPLDDLAYAMYDKTKLKQYVSQIVSTTTQKY